MKKKLGTRKPGIMSQGKLVMMALVGGPANALSGPGADKAPSATAFTRSAAPKTFHSNASIRTRAPNRAIDQASGGAATPAIMSPQPALGANGAGSLPAA